MGDLFRIDKKNKLHEVIGFMHWNQAKYKKSIKLLEGVNYKYCYLIH